MIKFFLPIAHPPQDLNNDTEKITHLNSFIAKLLADTEAFSPFNAIRHYKIDAFANILIPDAFKRITAMWKGSLSQFAVPNSEKLYTLAIDVNHADELRRILPQDIPYPNRMVIGPIELEPSLHEFFETQSKASVPVEAGDVLGELEGDTVAFGFSHRGFGANEWFLDPECVFRLVHEARLWDLPIGAPVPLVQSAAQNVIRYAKRPKHNIRPRYLILEYHISNLKHELHFAHGHVADDWVTFLSNEKLKIRVGELPQNATATLKVTDKTAGAPVRAPFTKTSSTGEFEFTPDVDLRPEHPIYHPGTAGNGTDEWNRELWYAFRVTTSVGGAENLLSFEISQDPKDRVRQEYIFHSPPYQTQSVGEIPPRGLFKKVVAQPDEVKRIDPTVMRTDNYVTVNKGERLRVTPNADGLLQVAQYIRRRYHYHQFEAISPHPLDKWHTADIRILRAWVNPERNELEGREIDDATQYGFTLELAPFHLNTDPSRTMQIVRLKDACLDFMNAIGTMNSGTPFKDLSVRMIVTEGANHHEIWRWAPNNLPDGTVMSGFAAAFGSITPILDDAVVYPSTTSVIVTWQPQNLLAELQYPTTETYPTLPTPDQFTNIVLYAEEENSSVAQADQAALDDVAETLLRWLNHESTTKNDINQKIAVGNPVRFLEMIGASNSNSTKIRYLFTISHGYPGYLVLTNYDQDDPVRNPPLLPTNQAAIKADQVLDGLRLIFGEKVVDDPENPYFFTHHSVHVENLFVLPDDIKRRLRHVFAQSEGVVLLGCDTNTDESLAFAQGLSEVLDRTIYGTSELSWILARDAQLNWNISQGYRRDGIHRESIVLPKSAGTEFRRNPFSTDEELSHINYIHMYKHFLKPVTI